MKNDVKKTTKTTIETTVKAIKHPKMTKNTAKTTQKTTHKVEKKVTIDLSYDVINLHGAHVRKIDLSASVFDVHFNPVLIKEIMDYQRSIARQATYGTCTISDLAYSTKKIRAQKGSGRARVGQRGPPHHRGGSVAFGPDGRHYKIEMPKGKLRKALAMCLSKKMLDKELIIVDELQLKEIKTKGFLSICDKLKLPIHTLFVDVIENDKFTLSMRNVIGYRFLPIIGLSPISLIKSTKMVITEEAIKKLEVRYESK
jgi:large subunit ribosomal protein L4